MRTYSNVDAVFGRLDCLNIFYFEMFRFDVAVDKIFHYFANTRRVFDHILLLVSCLSLQTGLVVRKLAFCICKNKDADQLRGKREADQRLCFRYIPGVPEYMIHFEILIIFDLT